MCAQTREVEEKRGSERRHPQECPTMRPTSVKKQERKKESESQRVSTCILGSGSSRVGSWWEAQAHKERIGSSVDDLSGPQSKADLSLRHRSRNISRSWSKLSTTHKQELRIPKRCCRCVNLHTAPGHHWLRCRHGVPEGSQRRRHNPEWRRRWYIVAFPIIGHHLQT
jgi:hypothetical protein